MADDLIVPAAWEHVEKFYNMLLDASEKVTVDGSRKHIWTGKITEAYKSLGIGQSYYPEVVTLLIRMGCIEYASRGSRGSLSKVELVKRPELSEWLDKRRFWLGKGEGLTRRGHHAKLQQQIDDLRNNVLGGMNIVEALQNFEERISALESKESNGTAQKKSKSK